MLLWGFHETGPRCDMRVGCQSLIYLPLDPPPFCQVTKTACEIIANMFTFVGTGLMVSALVRAPAGDIVLCSWARHLTLTMPLSTQVYKWVPVNCWGNLTNCGEVTCDGLASRPGGVETLLAASCYKYRDKLRQLGLSQTAPRLHYYLCLPFLIKLSRSSATAAFQALLPCKDTLQSILYSLLVFYTKSKLLFTITAEINARSLVDFYCQYAERIWNSCDASASESGKF